MPARNAVVAVALATLAAAGLAPAADAGAEAACTPRATILTSPRTASQEVQAKGMNDRGDIVGFADARRGRAAIHAILWRGGKARRAIDLGVLPGFVASEAYGINNRREVFGLLYDRQERTFPFRWRRGRMTLLRGPGGERVLADVPDRNTINARGEIAATLIGPSGRQAVKWSPGGNRATLLPALAGHTWTNAWSISDEGIVSGWSRLLPNDDGENNPVIWDAAGQVIALGTVPGRADGAAEATNRSGLTVGYLGNLGTDDDPERGNAAVWTSATAAPALLGPPAAPLEVSELVDVNDRGQAAGAMGRFTPTGFPLFEPAIWRPGWTALRPLRIPAAARRSRVVVAGPHDINARGTIVGNVFGLSAPEFSALRRIHPVRWTCPFGG